MFFTIEPMVNAGRPEVKVLDDGWTAVTRDRSLSAQFEHMVAVTDTGVRSLHGVAGGDLQDPLPGLTAMGQPFVTTQRLRFFDTDRLGHVNNAVFAMMYEAGRSELVDRLGLLDPRGALGVVIARLEIDFQREMNWPGEVRIETAVGRIGNKSLHLRQRLLVDGVQVSQGVSVLVVIDTATRRAVPIEAVWRERIAAYVLDGEAWPEPPAPSPT